MSDRTATLRRHLLPLLRRVHAWCRDIVPPTWRRAVARLNGSGRLFGIYLLVVALAMLALVLGFLWLTSTDVWGMYGYLDGRWAAFQLQGRLDWTHPFDLSPFNPLSGMGSLFLPNLAWVNPGSWSFALPLDRDLKYAISYSFYCIELALSSYALFRVIGLDRARSFLTTQFIFLLFFNPFDRILQTLPWYAHAPVNAHLATMCNLATIALLRLGRGTWRHDAAWFALLLTSAVIGFLSAPITILTYIPVYGLFCILLIASQRPDRRMIAVKAAAVLVVLVLFLLAGVPEFVISTSQFSSRAVDLPPILYPGWRLLAPDYWQEVLQRFPICGWPESRFLICLEREFSWFQIWALFGAGLATAFAPKLRAIALGYLAFVGLVHAWELVWHEKLLGGVSTTSAAFFVWAAIPFSVLFAAYPLGLVLSRVTTRRAWPNYPAMLLVPTAMVCAWIWLIQPILPRPPAGAEGSGILPPSPVQEIRADGAIFVPLVDATAIAPGRPFRGRVATYFGGPEGWLDDRFPTSQLGWPFIHPSRDYLSQTFGTTFQNIDLWPLGLPTFDEYGQWISRPAARMVRRLLEDERGGNWSSLLLVTRPNLPILRLMGVSHLVTDAALHDPDLVLTTQETAPGADGAIRLYRIRSPNLATYSPTQIETAASYEEALVWLDSHADSLQSAAVAFEPAAGPLVPARSSSLTFTRDGWRLEAESAGRSVIAVPVQFSHCWSIADRPAALRLYRGNAVQTFVEFEGRISIDVKYAFGLFGATSCRAQDIREFERLGV